MSPPSGVEQGILTTPAVRTPASAGLLSRLTRYRKRKGTLATLAAAISAVVDYVIRHRCRLVFEASLSAAREPSTWGLHEKLLIIGPDNLDELTPELLSTLEPDRHPADFRSIRDGNRLFVVVCDGVCVHRGYVCTVDRPALDHDRRAVFFGSLASAPMIRGSETTKYAAHRSVCRHIGKGLYTRVLNEQLRYLRNCGYTHAALFIMAENTLSIKGVTEAGFHLCRLLSDWVLFRSVIVQKVYGNGIVSWRIVRQ